MKSNKKMYEGLDLLKFGCSVLIVFLHINPFSKEGLFYNLSRAFATVGVPCFFMISGFLLFSKVLEAKQEERKSIIKKQIQRLLWLLGTWGAIYFAIYDIWWIVDGNIALNLLEYMHHILFGGEGFYLWYIVALIVAILFCYILHDKSKKVVVPIMLFLLMLGMIGHSYTFLIEDTKVHELLAMYTRFFYTFRNGVFWGGPCVYIGLLLAKSRIPSMKDSALLLALSVLLFLVEFISLKKNGYTYTTMQVSIVILAFSLLCFFCNVKTRMSKVLVWYLRKLSFLIYVIHPLLIILIPKVLYALRGIDYYWYLWYGLQIPLVIILAIIGGCMLIKASTKIKILKLMM